MFLEISQNSQENTYARASFLIKLQAEASDKGVFQWILRYFYELPFCSSLTSNFIWWSKKIHAFLNKIERTVPSETLGKRTIVLHGNKLVERIHVDKSSKYAIKGKLTTSLGS